MEKSSYDEDAIVWVIGGIHEYIGRLAEGPHLNGPDWIRILDPCQAVCDENGASISKHGAPHYIFEPFVDIRISPQQPIEVWVVKKGSLLDETYQEEVKRIKPQNIHLPDNKLIFPGMPGMPGGRRH